MFNSIVDIFICGAVPAGLLRGPVENTKILATPRADPAEIEGARTGGGEEAKLMGLRRKRLESSFTVALRGFPPL